MVTLVLAIILALGISYFSIQNTHGITLTLANYPLTDVPLYIVVVSSILIGLCIGFIMYMFRSLSSSLTIHHKDAVVKNANHTITELKTQLHDMQLENKLLREKLDEQYTGEKYNEGTSLRSHIPYLTRIRQGLHL